MYDCTDYNCDYTTDNDFNYCPDCGSEMTQRTLDDFDFPLRISTGCRFNINRKVKQKTGVDVESNHNFYDDTELLFDIEVTRDGDVSIVGGFDVDIEQGESQD